MPQDRIEQAKREAISLYQQGVRAQTLGDYPTAEECYHRCHTIMKAIGDHNGEAAALHYLGTLLESRFDLEEARNCYQESHRLFGEDNDQQNCLFSLFYQGMLAIKLRDYPQSITLIQDATGLAFSLGPTFIQEAWSRIRQMAGVFFAGRHTEALLGLGEKIERVSRKTQESEDPVPSMTTVKLAQLTQQLGLFLIGCARLWQAPERELPIAEDEFVSWLLQSAVNLDQATGTGLAFTDLASKVIQEHQSLQI